MSRACWATVLPDEDDGEEHPWEWLAELLSRHGITIPADSLRSVPYTVEFSERLQRLVATRPHDLDGHVPLAENATPGLAPAITDEVAERFRTLASHWDLAGLQAEIAAALDGVDPSRTTYVPAQLLRALDMFLDAYADTAPRERGRAEPSGTG